MQQLTVNPTTPAYIKAGVTLSSLVVGQVLECRAIVARQVVALDPSYFVTPEPNMRADVWLSAVPDRLIVHLVRVRPDVEDGAFLVRRDRLAHTHR